MHSFATVVVPFAAKRAPAVEQKLQEVGNPFAPALGKSLDDAAFVHFVSMTVVESANREQAILLLELTADGPLPQVFASLEAAIGPALREVFSACQVDMGGAGLADFLRRYHRPVGQGWFSTPGVNYDGAPGMSVPRIRQEAALAHEIANLLDRLPASTSALETLTRAREWLWNNEAMKWAFVAEPTPLLGPTPSPWTAAAPVLGSAICAILWPFLLSAAAVFALAWFCGPLIAAGALAALLLIAAAALGPATPFVAAAVASLLLGYFADGFVNALWAGTAVLLAELGGVYALLRRQEDADVSDDAPPSAALVEAIMQRENFGVQNHLAAASTMKGGWLRRRTLCLGLWVAGQLALHFSEPGFLGPTGVIHSARWILLPGTDKLIFRSNFDGGWERYLEDFIELAYQGVNGIWSNTVGFPKTTNLFVGGARDGDRLRRWTRRQQQPTLAWYSAYPRLTLARIRINAAIRQGVAEAVTEADAADWLACFGSSPRPADLIEGAEIPTLVFGGLRRLRYGACLLIQLPGVVDEAKAWLAQIAPDLSFGDQYDADAAMLIGIAAGGFTKLGLAPDELASFPVAFQQGSAAPWRARAVHDTGRNAPEHWLWGRNGAPVDAVLLLYASDAATLDRAVQRRSLDLGADRVTRVVRFKPLPAGRDDPVREPFGYVDGVSDPAVRGMGRWTLPEKRRHLVEPGEFVLGYPDNLGFAPSSPLVAAGADPTGVLPAAKPNLVHPRPEFSTAQPSGQHDLGRNGTFLVMRHLEQDATGFEAFLDAGAAQLGGMVPQGATPAKEWIAAKMVGRWRSDGSSLVRHPQRPRQPNPAAGPAGAPDNDFLYGVEDPDGMRCPFGAHVRRANPRESLAPPDTSPSAINEGIESGSTPFDKLTPAARVQLAISNRHRILRVGRAYEPQGDLEKPGILFMCLNADIERQFEFIQQTWVLGSSFQGLEAEVDPLMGQRGSPTDVVLTIPAPGGPIRLKGMSDFVTVKGSGYFFLPGKSAIAYLSLSRG